MSKVEYLAVPRSELEEILEILEDSHREIEWFKEDDDILLQNIEESIETILRRLKQQGNTQ